MSDWKTDFPLLSAHVGEWEGEYVHLDASGAVVDRHQSHLKCWLPEDGTADIVQVNTYTWADGRQQQVEFAGTLRGKDVHFDNDRIIGHMHQADDRTILLTWRYKFETIPDSYLYELIQLSLDGQQKVRTWQWMEADRLVKRTVINEMKTA
jgi:hypothetical protein